MRSQYSIHGNLVKFTWCLLSCHSLHETADPPPSPLYILSKIGALDFPWRKNKRCFGLYVIRVQFRVCNLLLLVKIGKILQKFRRKCQNFSLWSKEETAKCKSFICFSEWMSKVWKSYWRSICDTWHFDLRKSIRKKIWPSF